ncbi:MAG: prephenate dehydratase domain-containing protein [Arcobacteraceae bacterium]
MNNTVLENINSQILKLLKKRKNIIKDDDLPSLSITNQNFLNQITNMILDTVDYEKIVYLGPEGSYTQEAVINKLGNQNNYYSVNSITNIFFEISEGRAKYGIVPIENSSNGIVGDTINCFNNYDLNIVGETVLDIHHTLVSNCTKVEDIKVIFSKDIAFDQCSIFLENYHLNETKYVYVESTTKAAKLAAKTKNSAAICSQLAATTHFIPVLFKNIEDNKENKTRFFIISKEKSLKSNNDKTSIIVQLPNKYGSLIEFLNNFKKAKISLNKIKSHIVNGVSTFFIEFDGHQKSKTVQKILNKNSKYIKVLGSYPKEVDDI